MTIANINDFETDGSNVKWWVGNARLTNRKSLNYFRIGCFSASDESDEIWGNL